MSAWKQSLWPQLRRIFALGKPYRLKIAFCMLLLLLATGIQLSLPIGIQTIFDQVIDGGNRRLLNTVAVGLMLLFVVRSALAFYGTYLLSIVGYRIVTNLRARVQKHFVRLGLRFYHQQRTGDLVSRLSNDTASIREAVTDIIVATIMQAFTLIGSIVVMIVMNWRLSLVVLAIAPISSWLGRLFSPTFQKVAYEMQSRLAAANAVAQEMLSAIQVVKAFARDKHEASRYGEVNEDLFGIAVKSRKIYAFFNALINFVTSSSTIAIFWFGGNEVLSGRLTAGELVAFLLYSQNITNGFNMLAQQYIAFSQAAGASKRVFEILDTEPEIRELPEASSLKDHDLGVKFENVTFSYQNEQAVLRGINLEAKPGETVALVGPSGAGKSTILQLIPRFYDPEEGRVLVDGQDVKDLQILSLRERVASVSQEVFLFGFSIRENIRYGRLDATDEEVEEAARQANAHDFISQLPEGYDTQVGERGIKLSGGERQRISIARALLKDARVLILDEATSSVDATSESLIQDALERLRRQRTTFVIAHRLSTVRNADRILVIKDGQIEERGTHDELLKKEGLYHQLVQTQFRDPTAA